MTPHAFPPPSPAAPQGPAPSSPDPIPRLLSAAAVLISLAALVFSMGGLAPAARESAAAHHKHPKGKGQQKAIAAINKHLAKLAAHCPVSNAIDLGSWCLESTTFRIPAEETGKNDYLYATQKCVKEGGWLPSAAQLIGAAPLVSLKSTIDDDPATSATNENPEARNGIKDEREMSGDLFTTAAGPAAAGSEGVTEGSKGVGSIGEPNPVPMPADPLPGTLDYVTVYDNHNIGGFAGGEPVGKAENFRCAYAKGYQGKPKNVSSRS